MSLSLYEIADKYRKAFFRAESLATDTSTGEFKDDVFADLIREAEGELEEKLLALAKWTKELDAEAKAIKEEAAKLTERARSLASQSERVKKAIRREMPEGRSFRDTQAEIKWYEGLNHVELTVPLDQLESRFVKTTYVENKTALGQALKAGEKPESIGAKFVKGEKRLVIK